MRQRAEGRSWARALRSKRLAVMLPLGYASGLPLALSGTTLQAWLADSGVDVRTIGAFSLVGLPYVLKPMWAPLLDRFAPPWPGRRRGWMLLAQGLLVLAIAAFAFVQPAGQPTLLAALALLLATLSASQDIAFDAYRTDLLEPEERGMGAALTVAGYRVGMIDSGALALVIAEAVGWAFAYATTSLRMIVGAVGTLLAPEPKRGQVPPASMAEAVVGPLRELLLRPGSAALLALVALYKLGDALVVNLSTAFLVGGLGFSVGLVGGVYQGLGLAATLVGALVGGALMLRWSLARSLLTFGLLQALSNLAFLGLALSGKSLGLLVVAVAIENLSAGLGTAAFVALLMQLCDARYTATQFALLTALASLGRVIAGPAAGGLAHAFGWPSFYALSVVAALPGLGLVWLLRPAIDRSEHADSPQS
jgi:PAT family beta-lactamase induction signal transducer AmpG